MVLKRVGRWFLRGLDWYVRQLEDAHNPIRDVEPPDGEVICPTCLGNGGWSYDWEGGWMDCPTCQGRGTVQIPPGKI
jgi:hypothetical protein